MLAMLFKARKLCGLTAARRGLVEAAQPPARGHDGEIGAPRDHSGVGAGGRTVGAGVTGAAHSQEVVVPLSVECLDRHGDFCEGNGALLVVAVVARVAVARDAAVRSRAAVAGDGPAAWRRGRSGDGLRRTALAHVELLVDVACEEACELVSPGGSMQCFQDLGGEEARVLLQ